MTNNLKMEGLQIVKGFAIFEIPKKYKIDISNVCKDCIYQYAHNLTDKCKESFERK